LLIEQNVNKVLVPLLEKENPTALKALRSQQKEKGKKKEEKPPTDQAKENSGYPKTSIIEKAAALPRIVYAIDASSLPLATAIGSSATEMV